MKNEEKSFARFSEIFQKSELKELRNTEFSDSISPEVARRDKNAIFRTTKSQMNDVSSTHSNKSQKSWREISLRRKLDYRLEEISRRTDLDPFNMSKPENLRSQVLEKKKLNETLLNKVVEDISILTTEKIDKTQRGGSTLHDINESIFFRSMVYDTNQTHANNSLEFQKNPG